MINEGKNYGSIKILYETPVSNAYLAADTIFIQSFLFFFCNCTCELLKIKVAKRYALIWHLITKIIVLLKIKQFRAGFIKSLHYWQNSEISANLGLQI